jgi:hypothetical protein
MRGHDSGRSLKFSGKRQKIVRPEIEEVTLEMAWNLSLQLVENEEMIEDSTKRKISGIRAAYSVFLTNKRALFRFDGLGSSLTQSFIYKEILDAKPCKRLLVNYLIVKTEQKDYFINIPDPEYWAERIKEIRAKVLAEAEQSGRLLSLKRRTKRELTDMLIALRKYSIINDQELEAKIKLVDAGDFE